MRAAKWYIWKSLSIYRAMHYKKEMSIIIICIILHLSVREISHSVP